jgi:hypothetical protein
MRSPSAMPGLSLVPRLFVNDGHDDIGERKTVSDQRELFHTGSVSSGDPNPKVEV